MAQPSVDLMARWVIMSSFLYYGLDAPFLSDAEYDAAAQRVLKEWESLIPQRQWQLGSPEQLAATGFLTKITPLGVSAAIDWAGITQKVVPTQPWEVCRQFDTSGGTGRPRYSLRWLNVGHFTYA